MFYFVTFEKISITNYKYEGGLKNFGYSKLGGGRALNEGLRWDWTSVGDFKNSPQVGVGKFKGEATLWEAMSV